MELISAGVPGGPGVPKWLWNSEGGLRPTGAGVRGGDLHGQSEYYQALRRAECESARDGSSYHTLFVAGSSGKAFRLTVSADLGVIHSKAAGCLLLGKGIRDNQTPYSRRIIDLAFLPDESPFAPRDFVRVRLPFSVSSVFCSLGVCLSRSFTMPCLSKLPVF